jgi:bacillithiol system protein YtxJ
MNWINITDLSDLDRIKNESFEHNVLLFKHSTSCSISLTALNRLERNWKEEDSEKLNPFYLDLLNHRDVSNAIAEIYGIEHQSPQVLVIKDGKCIYTETHYGISYEDLMLL